MTDYALTGKKGTGKSKHAVLLIRDRYLKKKRAVATNLDIELKPLMGVMSKATYVRIPDKPTAFDLEAVGHGNPDSYNEDENGGMFLDELGTWLNTRTFGDKDRAAVLDYFAHGRKHGWDTWYIMQNVAQVDKQLRESFIEQTVRHQRFDKVRVPFIGGLLSLLFGEKAGYFPKFHVATYRIGVNPQDLVCNRAQFVGKDIESCYDTRQVFRQDYPHGTHSVLSPWHVEGRYLVADKPGFLRRLGALVVGWFGGPVEPVPAPVALRARSRVSSGYARVKALAARLPADQAMAICARYLLVEERRGVTPDGVR